LGDRGVPANGLFHRIRGGGRPGCSPSPSSSLCIPATPAARYVDTKDNGIMKRLLATVALLAVSGLAAAQALVAGEVKKIDKPAGRITLKHAEIKAYDMPGMTGAYKVQDPSMLDKVQVGDHVQFSLDRVNSVYTITKIDVQK
jgi:Cu(I)/Ag(I) efflux system periplasmic protein CusF